MRLPRIIVRAVLCLFILAALSPANRAAAKAFTGPQLGSAPGRVDFGRVPVGRTKNAAFAITNSGALSVTISQVTVVGSGFSLGELSLPVTLNGGKRVTLTASFTPASKGNFNGTIYVVSTASNQVLNIPLSGFAYDGGELTVSPSNMNFNNVILGFPGIQTGMLSATTADVTVSSVTSSNSQFAVTGLSLPMTIPVGQSVPFTVVFAPQNLGPASTTLTFYSDADDSPTYATASGNGVPLYSVNLGWNASTSQNIIGYNIYRGTVSGGPYSRMNSTPDPNLTYTDTTVSGGTVYYYVTTAVNSNNQESGYSSEIPAVIP
jgi:hypothetical protein